MKDKDKTKDQLLQELKKIKEINAGLEVSEAAHLKSEEALKLAEERFRAIAESTPDAVVEINSLGNIIFWNKAAERIYGYTKKEVTGKPIDSLLPERFRELSRKGRKEFFKTGSSSFEGKTIEATGLKKDGTEFPVEISFSIWKSGTTLLFGGIIRDITERKKAEEELTRERNFISAVIDTSAALVTVLDPEGRIVRLNRALLEISGYAMDEVKGLYFWDVFLMPEEIEPVKKSFSSIRKAALPINVERNMVTKGGDKKNIAWSNTAIFNKEDSLEFVICTGIDITDRKAAEKALRNAFNELEEKVKERTAELTDSNLQLKQEIIERTRVEEALRAGEEDLGLQAQKLEDVNAALRVLLRRHEEDKIELEEKVLANMKDLVSPYIDKIKQSRLSPSQKNCMEVIESNLNDIISPFSRKLSSKYLNLTPREIQIAGLISDCKTSKEIANFLNTSITTVAFHRRNIRIKLGLSNKKANLSTHLQSLV